MAEKQTSLEQTSPVIVAECRLLNAIYLNPDLLLDININEGLFANQTSKAIFNAMDYLDAEDIPFSINGIFQYASGLCETLTINQVEVIANLENKELDSYKDVIDILQSTQKSLKAIDFLRKAEFEINKSAIKTSEINEKIRQLVIKAEECFENTEEQKKLKTYNDLAIDYREIRKERRNGKVYKFGDPILDKAIIYGPEPGQGGILCGDSGSGKSCMVLNIINNLENIGVPCLYYSLEMSEANILDRKTSMRTEIPLSDIINPPDLASWQAIDDAAEKLFNELKENKKFRFSDSANISLAKIKKDILQFQRDIGQKYMVVVFDLLSMVKEFYLDNIDGKNFSQVIEVAINRLCQLAKELEIHYIAVLQLKRKEDKLADDLNDIEKLRPTANGIKNSGAFKERCRYVLGLFRPRFYAEQYLDEELYQDMEDYCKIYSLKQNSGQIGLLGTYLFDAECMKMIPVMDEERVSENNSEIEENFEE